MECCRMQDHTSSSNINQSISSRDTTILLGSHENSACSTSNVSNVDGFLLQNPTCIASGSIASINPIKDSSGWPRSIRVSLNDVLRLFQIENFSNASEEETMFFFHLFFGWTATAKKLARDANGKCDRALQALVSSIERRIDLPVQKHQNR